MKSVAALLFFIVLTIIFTYPLSQWMATSLVERGDSLLNTWIIGWDINKILSDPINLFHANIFYPFKYTLAYTEHMIGNALLGMPVYLATNNPILTYNFVLLATFIIGGWGMFLLVRYLTKSSLAGILAGIIFVYNPYRFYVLGHLHVLSIQWLPFTLLYLHKYFYPAPASRGGVQNRRNKDLLLFCIFFIIQGATSGHICLYQGFIVGLFLFFIIVSRENTWGNHWLKLGLGLGIAFLVLLPLYLPYMHLAESLRFIRQEEELKIFSASFGDFWGIMFPGTVASALAILGIFHSRSKVSGRFKYIVFPITIFIFITLAVIIYFLIYGGFDLGYSILGVRLKVGDLERPFFILLGLLIVKLFLQKKSYYSNRFYLVLALASFLFCLGPEIELKDTVTGPYMMLYNFFPGFKGLRVPSRWAVIFMFAVAVLAGLGWKKAEKRFWLKWTIFPVVFLVLLYGYLRIPLRLGFKIYEKPSVYEWLAEKPDEAVIIELPMPSGVHNFYNEAIYMYWSLFHNKRMVNGYSGYSPPPYWHIVDIMRSFPSEDSIHLLQYLGVKYILMHNGIPEERFHGFRNDLALRYKDGNDYIYELVSSLEPEKRQADISPFTMIGGKGEGFTGQASHNSDMAGYAYDNNIDTRWDTGKPQTSGMWFQLDLREVKNICRISLNLGKSSNDYPRKVRLSVSEDGIDWKEVDIRFSYSDFTIDLIENPFRPEMNLDFKSTPARYIKLTVTGEDPTFYWSIHEIEVGIL